MNIQSKHNSSNDFQDNHRHSYFSSDVIPFPKAYKKRWICNVSNDFKFASVKKDYLQITKHSVHSQFKIICKLLAANTCDVIYFDEQFNREQFQTLRRLQSLTQTDLIHAKQAYMFTQHARGYA